jgi:cardiolipin synthase C
MDQLPDRLLAHQPAHAQQVDHRRRRRGHHRGAQRCGQYFDATDDIVFANLDVLAVGPVAGDVALDFERYWNCASSRPVRDLLPRLAAERRAEIVEQATQLERSPAAAAYVRAVRELPFARQVLTGQIAFEWAPVRMLSDDPDNVHRLGRRQHVSFGIESIVGNAVTQFDLMSPYFVPTTRGVDALTKLSRRGVAIRVLTNSLATTDVQAVHAGYAKWRKPLLRAGIELREWRLASRATPKRKRIGVGLGWAGSAGKGSVASLHAKTFAVDRRRVFIGSFNFDQRSAYLNTELGFVIDSPALACSIEEAVEERLPLTTWKVSLTAKGELLWSGQRDGLPEEHSTEPGTRFHQRAGVCLLALLPIDWLL